MRYANTEIKYHCDFCPKTFQGGASLKHHVQTDHPEIGEALRRLLPEIEKENEEMLPNAGAPRQGGRQSGGGGDSLPYLNQSVLSTEPKEGEILAVRNEPKHRFGPSVVVKLSLENKTYLWTLNINNNPNFAILLKQFGKDEAKWAGKKILLVLEQDEFSEQYNIRTHFPRSK